MARHCAEARKIARELDKFRLDVSADVGEEINFDQADQARIELIQAAYDRRERLLGLYDAAEDVKDIAKLASEIRLIESQAARLIREIQKALEAAAAPPKQPTASRNAIARKAAAARWHPAAN
jgi:predicted  nucleic acid-binding Zn-ribbon protein